MNDFEEKQIDTLSNSQIQIEAENKIINEVKDQENEFDGIQSLIRITKKSTNVSSTNLNIGTPLLKQIQDTGIGIGTQFMYSANCSDLWKYLRMRLKKFSKLFEKDDLQIIKRIILMTKLQTQYFLIKECEEQLGQDHQLVKNMEKVLTSYRNRPIAFSNADFKCSRFYTKYIEKQIVFASPPQKNYRLKIFNIISKLQVKQIENHNSLISDLLNQTLQCIYQTIKSSENSKAKQATIVYLIVYYLKISLSSKKWIYVLVAEIDVNTMYMSLLSQSNGINKIIRFFQDATEESIQNEYQCTKEYSNKHEY